MIQRLNNIVMLHTAHTTYGLGVMETGQLEHLCYGPRIRGEKEEDFFVLREQHAFAPGNTCNYDGEHKTFSLSDYCLEYSSYGKGDDREPMWMIEDADGSRTSDFVVEGMEVLSDKVPLATLPSSYGDAPVETLLVTLRDKARGLKIELAYHVFEATDVITRTAKIFNESDSKVSLERFLSMSMDFTDDNFVMHTFHGAWAREMRRYAQPLVAGSVVAESSCGASSSGANPFVMIARPETDEDTGAVYGFNLIYSGNHYEAAQVNSFGKLRFVTGIQPKGFRHLLAPGEVFEAPEAVMSYSGEGFNGLSRHMHAFVRKHIVRGQWRDKVRPILLNSWEAAYFDINEHKLLKLAKAAKEAGVELFVMDDGWFGKRDDDTSSLGDWTANPKKLPNGVKGICDKVNKLGLDFGIWVEPEMVNVDSDLYRAHPDWVMELPKQDHAEGRNQRILDLSNEEVQTYIIDVMSELFASANIAYVKWDMNRTFTDVFSQKLPAEKQGEVAHRYIMGFYACAKALTEKFPQILFEGCASGGNRFDLGMLCYFPQIWASDDSDALCRSEIQTGYSYGYPMSCVAAHVSGAPNHQTLRVTPMDTRFAVASFGVLGYETNLCDLKEEEFAMVKAQVELYKAWRDVFFFGTFYRGRTPGMRREFAGAIRPGDGNLTEWTVVSEDGKRAVGMLMQHLTVPNNQFQMYYPKGLTPEVKYHFTNEIKKYNIKAFGDLINTATPVHVKQDSLLHDVIAKFVKMDGETEDFTAYGDTMMYGGVKLSPAFGSTGYSDQVRFFPDFASRLYFMEEVTG